MIKRCKVRGILGYYVNGSVKWKHLGHIWGAPYDSLVHDIVDDKSFDDRMELYRHTLDYLPKKGFYKSVVWKEKLLLKTLYGSYARWLECVNEMLSLNILVRDRDYLLPGEKP